MQIVNKNKKFEGFLTGETTEEINIKAKSEGLKPYGLALRYRGKNQGLVCYLRRKDV